MYNWIKWKPYKIMIFLSEMRKYVDFNVDSCQIFGHEFCQMNNHFIFNKPKMMIFHECLINFFDKVLGTHIWNTILVYHNPKDDDKPNR